MADALAEPPRTAGRLLAALPPFAGGSLQGVFLHHLNLGLRYGLFLQQGVGRATFALLATALGFPLISWFQEEMDRYLHGPWLEGVPLRAVIPGMAARFRDDLPRLTGLAEAPGPQMPDLISCALLPLWAQGMACRRARPVAAPHRPVREAGPRLGPVPGGSGHPVRVGGPSGLAPGAGDPLRPPRGAGGRSGRFWNGWASG